jgi:hypothetical protein
LSSTAYAYCEHIKEASSARADDDVLVETLRDGWIGDQTLLDLQIENVAETALDDGTATAERKEPALVAEEREELALTISEEAEVAAEAEVATALEVAAEAMEVPGRESELQWKLQQMSGVQPVTMPNPPKVINTCMLL